MALKLNLYYEIDRAKVARSRDPLKISLWGLGLIAACFAAYYFVQLAKMGGLAQQLSKAKAEFEAIEPLSKAAKDREEALGVTMHASQALVRRIEDRFYWAPLIEELLLIVPAEVQITKLAGDVQGDGLKKCKLTIDGLSAGSDPRRVAEELRTAIADSFGKKYRAVSSKFRTLEDGVEMVQIEGKAWPTATFAINVELETGEQFVPPPPPRKARKK